jgi:hypothetical protein
VSKLPANTSLAVIAKKIELLAGIQAARKQARRKKGVPAENAYLIVERQAEARFAARQKRGNPVRGRKLLTAIRQRIASSGKRK